MEGKPKLAAKKWTRSFSEILSKMEVHIERLQELISLGFQEEKGAIDSVIIQEYVDFQQTFLEFEKNIHDSTTKQNSNFKRKIFGLLILIFGFLILCLILIVRLINAYCLVEENLLKSRLKLSIKSENVLQQTFMMGLGHCFQALVYIQNFWKRIFC